LLKVVKGLVFSTLERDTRESAKWICQPLGSPFEYSLVGMSALCNVFSPLVCGVGVSRNDPRTNDNNIVYTALAGTIPQPANSNPRNRPNFA